MLYLGDRGTVDALVRRAGAQQVPPANPCWAEHGVMLEDPDGFRVVLVAERWEG